jgi:hypothetical protein
MTKPNIIVPDLPPLLEGYGPDVRWGAVDGRPHVWLAGDGRWLAMENCPANTPCWHAYKREPVKRVVYVNVYRNGAGFGHDTRIAADIKAKTGRTGCNRIELEEGRWDD